MGPRGFEASVQSPRRYFKIVTPQIVTQSQYQMRDLYNRQKTLTNWIKRVNEDLLGPDKTDILKLIEYMQDREKSILWIVLIVFLKPITNFSAMDS